MTDTFRAAVGRKVVSRSSAQVLGSLSHLMVEASLRQVTVVIIGRGRKAKVVEFRDITSFGPDAVLVADEGALRSPATDRERMVAEGKLELLGKRALTDMGEEVGRVDDVTFDPGTGTIESLRVGDQDIPADALLGLGSYAAVIASEHVALT
jgi:uncharacterized protein YrrD